MPRFLSSMQAGVAARPAARPLRRPLAAERLDAFGDLIHQLRLLAVMLVVEQVQLVKEVAPAACQ
jgi:hypothetical protein